MVKTIAVYGCADELFHPRYKVPFECGWRRELVLRRNSSTEKRPVSDVYYCGPAGEKLRLTRDVRRWLERFGDGRLSMENFTFVKRMTDVNDCSREVNRATRSYKRRSNKRRPCWWLRSFRVRSSDTGRNVRFSTFTETIFYTVLCVSSTGSFGSVRLALYRKDGYFESDVSNTDRRGFAERMTTGVKRHA